MNWSNFLGTDAIIVLLVIARLWGAKDLPPAAERFVRSEQQGESSTRLKLPSLLALLLIVLGCLLWIEILTNRP